MRKSRLGFAGLYIFALLLSAIVVQAAPQDTNFAGSWDMTVAGGGPGGEGGHRGGQGGGAQSLTITQDGGKYKVTHKTPRGEKTSDAFISGNTISWTEEREGRNGETRKIQFKATLTGDTLKGTFGGGEFSRDFTATRSK